ncbi:hypothetical protein [Planomonospora sp. ID82291]|uniref:hypothetical protein n=1 Tax=Planomonospora sp. ID82291 TaxID=2738136 RepID=UPI0018C36542|nr:hypothetical protein [Planomonospora sp. ID82291]MBG0818654.1 hypothetical protein [Planomonospora sp. ID82291]
MLTGTEKQALEAAVQAAGLGLGAIPAPLMADLLTAAHTSEIALERALRPSAPAVTGHAPP